MTTRGETITPPGRTWLARSVARRRQAGLVNSLLYVLLTLAALVSLFPLYWLFCTALTPFNETIKVPPDLYPAQPTLANVLRVFRSAPIGSWLLNTFGIAGLSTVFHLVFDSMSGYAFAKKRFFGREVLFWLVLSTMMIPAQVTIVPLFLMVRDLGLVDSYAGVLLPGLGDVFGIFLMKQYIQTLPGELEEAARIDGASELGIYARIVLPLCTPVLAVLAIFTFQRYWNAFLWPLIVLRDGHKFTVQVGLATMQGEFTMDYAILMAGAAIAAIPMMCIFFAFQRYFVQGIRIGAVKG